MKNGLVAVRNGIEQVGYKLLVKPVLFLQDPEDVHDHMMAFGSRLGQYKVSQKILATFFGFSDPMLSQTILGKTYSNPVGLAAGFDKNAQLVQVMPSVGFGFMEVGSVTGKPCEGNAKPRLWRLKKSQSLLVYYGLKNEGCERIAEKLQSQSFQFPLWVSVAKTNSPETVDVTRGVEDYAKAFRTMQTVADVLVVNISCPNAYGGLPFTDPARLEVLLARLAKIDSKKPVFLKLSPDLSVTIVNELLDIALKYKVAGVIFANLTKNRKNNSIKEGHVPENGGMSGKVVEDLSNALIKQVYQKAGNKLIIVGCGGVFSSEDAYKKIRLGASLVQLITGMIYQGPQMVSETNRGLVKLLQRDGFTHVSQAVGIDASR